MERKGLGLIYSGMGEILGSLELFLAKLLSWEELWIAIAHVREGLFEHGIADREKCAAFRRLFHEWAGLGASQNGGGDLNGGMDRELAVAAVRAKLGQLAEVAYTGWLLAGVLCVILGARDRER